MPSLLPKADPSYNVPNKLCSILVILKTEYCPIGVFCAVSTRLASTKNWKINESVPQFKNRMYFYYVLPVASYSIMFTSLNDYYEVNEKHVPQTVKLDVYKDINEAFKDVCEDLKQSIPSYDIYANSGDECERLSYMQSNHTEQQQAQSHQVCASACSHASRICLLV